LLPSRWVETPRGFQLRATLFLGNSALVPRKKAAAPKAFGAATWPELRVLNERYATSLDPELIASKKEAQYVEWISSTQPIWEVTEFARRVAGKAAVAVASGGILPVVTQTLEAIQLRDLFSVIVTSEQVPRGKPFPDMFLEAARRMEVNAADCLVLEDSPAGFQAATAAGMDYAVVTR
jgi:HAD superfamily hydrolase (TIGR01509 family)